MHGSARERRGGGRRLPIVQTVRGRVVLFLAMLAPNTNHQVTVS